MQHRTKVIGQMSKKKGILHTNFHFIIARPSLCCGCRQALSLVLRSGPVVEPWPHRPSVSVSVLTLASIPRNGYEADPWCGLYRYKSMWAITSVNADTHTHRFLQILCSYLLMESLSCDILMFISDFTENFITNYVVYF